MVTKRTPMLELHHVPIEVYWRTLELMGGDRCPTISECRTAIERHHAEAEIDDNAPSTEDPFARAVFEFMSGGGSYRTVHHAG